MRYARRTRTRHEHTAAAHTQARTHNARTRSGTRTDCARTHACSLAAQHLLELVGEAAVPERPLGSPEKQRYKQAMEPGGEAARTEARARAHTSRRIAGSAAGRGRRMGCMSRYIANGSLTTATLQPLYSYILIGFGLDYSSTAQQHGEAGDGVYSAAEPPVP